MTQVPQVPGFRPSTGSGRPELVEGRGSEVPQAQRRAPGFLYAALRVFDLSLGEMLWSRRTVFMALVVGLPVLIALVLRVLLELGAPPISVQHSAASGPVIFGLMMWGFFVRFSIPVLGVFYGTALIADEVEDKTITYLFSRPIPRGAVLFGKYLAYLACTIFVVLPAVMTARPDRLTPRVGTSRNSS